MKPQIPISLAVEDAISEAVLRRLLRSRPAEYVVGTVFRKDGKGYLQTRARAFNNMARSGPVLMLADLDTAPCPPALIAAWLRRPLHRDFLLRIAVREVEAWLLVPNAGFASFTGTRRNLLPQDPEALPDPKAKLLSIVQYSRARRDALVRVDKNGTCRQGPAYNSTLAEFVSDSWVVKEAVKKCQSLARLVHALENLESDWRHRTS